MAANTEYKVGITYDIKGSAAGGLKNIKQEAKGASEAMGGLKRAMAVIGGVVGGVGLFNAGKKAFIDFNSEITRMKNGLATITSMNLGVGFTSGQKAADRMFETFQKMAAVSPATTKDFTEMASMISSSVLQAGLGLKDLENMTQGAIGASMALGARPDMLALDITQMLAGTVAIRDRYARQLLAGIGETDYHKFNKYDAGKRAQLTQKAFDQPSLKQGLDAASNTFEGVTSTFKDNLEIALGKVGLPLMKALTTEIKSWSTWIDKNPAMVASISSTISNGLVKAFEVVKEIGATILPVLANVAGVIKDAFSFVVENKDLLLTVVKGLMVYKGAMMAKGIGGGLLGALKGGGDSLTKLMDVGTQSASAANGLEAFTSGISQALPGVLKLAGILIGIASLPALLDPRQRWRDEDTAKRAAELKTSGDFSSSKAHIGAMRLRLGQLGIDPDGKERDSGGIKDALEKEQAAYREAREKVIQTGLDKGVLTEQLSADGTRRIDMAGGSGGVVSKEMMDTIGVVVKDAAFQAWHNTPDGMPKMGGWSNNQSFGSGYFTENIGKQATDAYDLRAEPPKVNVTINKIEVYSDDPDRFVAQAVQSFDEITRNPTQAHDIMRGAF